MTFNYDEEHDTLGIIFESFAQEETKEIVSQEKEKEIYYYIMKTEDGRISGIEIMDFKKQFD